jgi:hypothetical protein
MLPVGFVLALPPCLSIVHVCRLDATPRPSAAFAAGPFLKLKPAASFSASYPGIPVGDADGQALRPVLCSGHIKVRA